VANVLVVTAFKLSYPMVLFVLMKAHDLSIHGDRVFDDAFSRGSSRSVWNDVSAEEVTRCETAFGRSTIR